MGVFVLCFGTLIYLSDRSPDSTYFVKEFLSFLSFHGKHPDMFGFADRSLASFLHVFSFSMITAGIIAQSRKGYLVVTLGWAAVNFVCELGQYFDTFAVRSVPAWFERYPLLETVDDYFVAGCFDCFDVAAIFAGGLAGYLVLLKTKA
ncbi:MAG: hypothetical protein U9N77_04260 [Thermodesulfobacteriota bacterium]|nr:hypothetical protein [Thermodesulfobacteriota bacterium]